MLPGVLRLVTIPISHYCEKARWALERAGIPYREERHVQAIHRIAARRAGGGATVPVLVTPEGVLGESEEILVWIDQRTPPEHRLFPAEPPRARRGRAVVPAFRRGTRADRPAADVHPHARPAKAHAALQQPGRAGLGGSGAPPGMAARRALGAARACHPSGDRGRGRSRRLARVRLRRRACSPTAASAYAVSASAPPTSPSRRFRPRSSCHPCTASPSPSPTFSPPTRPRSSSARVSTRPDATRSRSSPSAAARRSPDGSTATPSGDVPLEAG